MKYPKVYIRSSFATNGSPVISEGYIIYNFSWSNIFLKHNKTTATFAKKTKNAKASTSLITCKVSGFAIGTFQN